MADKTPENPGENQSSDGSAPFATPVYTLSQRISEIFISDHPLSRRALFAVSGGICLVAMGVAIYYAASNFQSKKQENLPTITLAGESQSANSLEGKLTKDNVAYMPSEKPTIEPNQTQAATEQIATSTEQTVKPYCPLPEEVEQNEFEFRDFFFRKDVSARIAALYQAVNHTYLPNSHVRICGYAQKGALNPELLAVTGATDNQAFKEGLLNILKDYKGVYKGMPSGAFDVDFVFTAGGKK